MPRLHGSLKKDLDANRITAPLGTSRCVAGDSLIFTSRGMLTAGEQVKDVPAGAFVSGDLKVDTGAAAAVSSAVYNGGVCETRRLHLIMGYELEMTPEHPVRVLRHGQLVWVRADELRKWDYVMLRVGSSAWGRTASRFGSGFKLDLSTAEVLGLLVANGSNIETIRCWTEARKPRLAVDQLEGSDGYVIRSAELKEFLVWVGFDDSERGIPERVRCAGPKIMRAFLRGLFDGMGVINQKRCVVEVESDSK